MKSGFTASARDALALAARELVRVAACVARVEADLVQGVGDIMRLLPARDHSMDAWRLAHDLRDAQTRIERGEWVLEDHLHGKLPGAALAAVHRADILAAPFHRARARRLDAGHDPAERALAAARLAHQPHDLAVGDVEVDLGHRLHDGLTDLRAERVRDAPCEIDLLREALGDPAKREEGAAWRGHLIGVS
jgi:hypothetical protein